MKYILKNINEYDITKINEVKKYIQKNKLKKINKIQNTKYKNLKIISEDILITGLKSFFNEDYNLIKFEKNINNKPYIINRKDIYFNISHSYDFCICAFSNKEIGVDIEKIRETNLNVINQFATEKEKEYIFKSKEKIYERLFEIYTLKEAYFKMKGTNLKDIKNIEFIIKNKNITCNDKNVELKIEKKIKGYIISFCKNIN